MSKVALAMANGLKLGVDIFAAEGLTVKPLDLGFEVTWSRGGGNSEENLFKRGRVVMAYSYRLFKREAGETEFVCILDDKDVYKHIDTQRLKSNKVYEYKVESYSLPMVPAGSGPVTSVVSSRMKEGRPDTPPTNFTATNFTFDEITVAWEPPSSTSGSVLGYRLLFDTEGAKEYNEVQLPASMMSYKARLLEPGTEYRFQIIAFSDAGDGPISSVLFCKTHESAKSRSDRLRSSAFGISDASKTKMSVSVSQSDHYTKSAEHEQENTNAPEEVLGDEWLEQQKQDWKQARLSGHHRKARPKRENWMTSSSETPVKKSYDAPRPQDLSDTRPTGASAGYEADIHTTGRKKVTTLEGVTTTSLKNSNEKEQEKEIHPKDIKRNVTKKRLTLEEKFLKKLADSNETESSEEEEEIHQPEVTEDTLTQKQANWLQYPKDRFKSSEPPQQAPPPVKRASSRRLVTRAESEGVIESIPIEGSIKSKTGTIRGKKNAVRANLEVITGRSLLDSQPQLMFDNERKLKHLIVYTSSNAVVREQYDRCNSVLKLFDFMRLKVHKRDLFMDKKWAVELDSREKWLQIPVVFAGGVLLGDAEKVMMLNETGKLKEILRDYEEAPTQKCQLCGGAGYINCSWCQGSTKSTSTPFITDDKNLSLKCSLCNSNGLQRCPAC